MSKQTELAQVADTITVDSGNVDIAGTLTSDGLTVDNGVSSSIRIAGNGNNAANTEYATLEFYNNDPSTAGPNVASSIKAISAQGTGSGAHMVFGTTTGSEADGTSALERMRIDSSGNLLVGTTDTDPSNDTSGTGGIALGASGYISLARANSTPLLVNRIGADGENILMKKDGSTVGSIGSLVGTRLTINSQSTAGYLGIGGTFYYAWNADDFRPMLDNSYDLGDAAARFDDIYATNGTIQTSDRNEKQDIKELSDAEQRVAVAAKGLLRKFRWRDAVAEKGDEARTHFGIIAQDLQAAFAAEGLDAGDYAMFISSTWWEHDVEVPAVEAVAEVLDEEGNVVTEAVETKDAYTRTDTYDTQEEAPEGATERTRLGVRYSELLAFIIGAL